jgi:methylglyoxal synthase
MIYSIIGVFTVSRRKTIALVAHDHKKQDLVDWVQQHKAVLLEHQLVCTGTTGKLVEKTLIAQSNITPEQLAIHKLKSGPLGGDQQLGALICEGKVDVLFFFWDPMEPHPHDVDVKALLRIAVVYNIPFACNRSSADYLISSPLIDQDYRIQAEDYSSYIERELDK